jgi:hypothetical protein
MRGNRHGLARPAWRFAIVLGSETVKVLTHSDVPAIWVA